MLHWTARSWLQNFVHFIINRKVKSNFNISNGIDLIIFLCSHLYRAGLDLENGQIRDNKAAGVLEPLMSKVKSIKMATEAAITILRIDYE
jgi:chaperonin GroEL (HSP60 family)